MPTSQKAADRPISFLLQDGLTGEDRSFDMIIRPEELTRSDPSRIAVSQTLGGAWADNFGPGVANINISGHTGWRGNWDGIDGQAFFALMYDTIYTGWHARRAAAVEAGRNPDIVRLIFADKLDNFVNVVAPMNFTLRRSKSSPLLMRFNISLSALSDSVDLPGEGDGLDDLRALGLDSLADTIVKIEEFAGKVRKWIDANLVKPVQEFLEMANTVFRAVMSVVKAAQGIVTAQTNQLLGLARDIAQTGRNAFYTFNSIMEFPDLVKSQFSRVASAFSNAYCIVTNVFTRYKQYQDYSSLYGSSNCSSTAGGSPLSPLRYTNAFAQIAPPNPSAIVLTPLAQSSINAGKRIDPVLAPLPLSQIGVIFGAIGNGVTIP